LKPAWANSLQDIISKTTQHKNRVGSMAKVVEHLPSKCEALNSSPNTVKKKTNKQVTGAGGVVQCVECFLSMCKVLSSIPIRTKKLILTFFQIFAHCQNGSHIKFRE
jgi:hypothetical protein